MSKNNLILRTDSYKISHYEMLPENTSNLYSYLESRGGLFQETVFFGLQYYLKQYLTTPITMGDINDAEKALNKHLAPGLFNRKGWERIVNVHGGLLPLRIKAVPEGSVIPTRNVLMTVENTDPQLSWLTNYVETLLLKIWYPTTVATLSREIKKVISVALERTGDSSGLMFKLHDFGYRGVSSEESAGIGGMAHLVNFMGTDTILALEYANEYYDEDMAGFSIPATEHSVMSILGEQGETEQMIRFLDTFGQGNFPAIACVSDTYDIFKAAKEKWGGELKGKVKALKMPLVVRPDSGDPPTIVRQVIELLDEAFGHTRNVKGFKVLNNVRVIQGDGITLDTIQRIINEIEVRGWSIDNVAFGMGGALLQQCNRDTQRFAFKASSAIVNSRVRDVQKTPVTDNGKRSKKGRLKLLYREGVYETVSANTPGNDELQLVYENGKLFNTQTFADIRERAAIPVNTVKESIEVWQ